MAQVLDSLLSAFRETAGGLPDRRTDRNTRYEVSDAAGCALACYFTRCESFLEFRRSMERVCKPGSHKRLYKVLESRQPRGAVQSTGWLPRRGHGKGSERHRFRRADELSLRKHPEARQGTRIEYAVASAPP